MKGKLFCFAAFVFAAILSSGAYAADLTINTIDDLTNNCPYNSATRTYSCTGWNDIKIGVDLNTPNDCGTFRRCRRNRVGPCTARNVVFEASNSFSARNLYATSHSPGSITIRAKTITANSINTFGGECTTGSCSCDTPSCSNSGGAITLTADQINVPTLNANDGRGNGGSGGTITVTANNTNVQNIYSSGSGYFCSYDYGYDDGSGSGGSVTVKSTVTKISNIYVNGGGPSSYCGYGGSGGTTKIVSDVLTLGSVSANGGSAGGSGGNAKLFADNLTVSSISETGASGTGCGTSSCCRNPGSGGFAGLFRDLNFSSPSISLGGGSLYYCTSCYGCCFWRYGSEGQKMMAPRTGGGFYLFESNVPSQYRSFQAKVKNVVAGGYVKVVGYNVDWSLAGTINGGYIKSYMGFITKMNAKLGADYQLELRVSPDTVFDEGRCATVGCANYYVPYVAY